MQFLWQEEQHGISGSIRCVWIPWRFLPIQALFAYWADTVHVVELQCLREFQLVRFSQIVPLPPLPAPFALHPVRTPILFPLTHGAESVDSGNANVYNKTKLERTNCVSQNWWGGLGYHQGVGWETD